MPGITTLRGYGHPHQQARARWAPIVNAGQAYCAEDRCLMSDRWIEPGTPWHLAHDHINGGYKGPAHKLCNESEGGTRGGKTTARIKTAKRRARWVTSRQW
ncbi:MAG TPA: hypothetical protein VIV12_04290 [Streptosporangiaceae bacterium]